MLLDEHEQLHFARFNRLHDANRWCHARVTLKQILARHVFCEAQNILLARSIFGKPSLAPV